MAEKPRGSEAPFPDTYDACVAEIRRLRAALLHANERWMEARTKAHLDAKSRRAQTHG